MPLNGLWRVATEIIMLPFAIQQSEMFTPTEFLLIFIHLKSRVFQHFFGIQFDRKNFCQSKGTSISRPSHKS